jgi:hypothetical protein
LSASSYHLAAATPSPTEAESIQAQSGGRTVDAEDILGMWSRGKAAEHKVTDFAPTLEGGLPLL